MAARSRTLLSLAALSLASLCHTALGLTALALGAATLAAHAEYPDRPIRVIVPIAAGSVTDVIIRAMASELAPHLGQQLVIENRGGASGIPGGAACAAATPDGYTICLVYHSTMSINPWIFNKLPYDPDRDFAPVTNLYFLVEAVFVSTAIEANNAAELKALAQAKPTALNFGTLGPGSFPDLFLRWINHEWNVGIVGIPYKGGGPIAQELVAGQIQVAKMGLGNFMGLLATGKIRPIAVAAQRRSPLLPDVPTFAEAGLDYPGFGWWGLTAPKAVPRSVIDRLNAEFTTVLRDPKMIEFMEKQAVQPAPGTPAEFAAFLKKDRRDAESVIKLSIQDREDYKPE